MEKEDTSFTVTELKTVLNDALYYPLESYDSFTCPSVWKSRGSDN